MVIPIKGFMLEASCQNHSQYPTVDGRRQPCMDFELNAMECLEAYGAVKGQQMCIKYIEDLSECRFARLRLARTFIMKQERYKKILKGEIPFSERHGKPYNYDSFVYGVYFP